MKTQSNCVIFNREEKMNKLIKIEMERAFKNKMLIISVVIGLVIVGFNIWNEIIPARKTLDKLLEMGKYSGIQLPGLYMVMSYHENSKQLCHFQPLRL